MQFQKLSAPSLKELFVTELESKILSGELPVGTKLPSERELAASMQVSRAVVNTGIAEMEQKGFLVVKPRIGAFVEDYRKNGTLETLVSIMKYNGGTLGDNEVKSILEFRIVLVTLAYDLALQNANDEDFEIIRTKLAELSSAKEAEEIAQKVYSLYHELAFISGNTLLPLFVVSFQELVCNLWCRYINRYGATSLLDNTSRLFNAILSKDTDLVHQLIQGLTEDTISGSHEIYKNN